MSEFNDHVRDSDHESVSDSLENRVGSEGNMMTDTNCELFSR